MLQILVLHHRQGLTNEKTVLSLLTKQSTVLKELTNEKTVLMLLTNQNTVLKELEDSIIILN